MNTNSNGFLYFTYFKYFFDKIMHICRPSTVEGIQYLNENIVILKNKLVIFYEHNLKFCKHHLSKKYHLSSMPHITIWVVTCPQKKL